MIYFINMLMYTFLIIMLYQYFNKTKITILDFLLLLITVNIYTIFIFYNLNFLYGFFFSIIVIIIKKLYFLIINNKKIEKESILIKEGLINFHTLVENNYSYNKLIKFLKKRKINLDEIEYCFLKNDDLLIIKNDKIKNYPISIIVDGQILSNNLKTIKKDYDWLELELKINKLTIDKVDYAYYKKNKLYFITNFV